jgi:2-dehydro-3-deoxyphosphogluconate aldolase/(4S)-4-hydroxy-2-oxoglutarate aldolase
MSFTTRTSTVSRAWLGPRAPRILSDGLLQLGEDVEFEGARPPIPAAIRDTGVVAIGRRLDAARVASIADALMAGGVRAFELTLDEPAAGTYAAIEGLARRFDEADLVVGAGTVLSIPAAERAIDAGARFLVSPHIDVDLVRWAALRGVPCLPGALTPSEVLAAWRAGAAAVKLFPASVAGPALVRELRGPMPQIPLLPTGGVTVESAPVFIAAGAAGVGMGGWLTGDGAAAGIERRAASIISAVAAARAELAA